MKEVDFYGLGSKEQNTLVHEKVFGHSPPGSNQFEMKEYPPVEPYVSDIAAACRIMEKPLFLGLKSPALKAAWVVTTYRRREDGTMTHLEGTADGLPLALCIGALKAVGEIED